MYTLVTSYISVLVVVAIIHIFYSPTTFCLDLNVCQSQKNTGGSIEDTSDTCENQYLNLERFPFPISRTSNTEKLKDLFTPRMSVVPPVIIPAAVKHTATILFLHGLGDTGHGWASSLAEIKPPHAKLICPTAEEAPVTINGGSEMPSWFDIRSLDKNDGNEDKAGVQKASELVNKMIDDEIEAGIPANRIVLGGFSQGGALSLYTGLTGRNLLGGVLVMSGYLPIRDTIDWGKIQKPTILQCHGDRDPVVLYDVGKTVSEILAKQNLSNYTFKTYKGLDHSANDREMRDVGEFLKERLPPV